MGERGTDESGGLRHDDVEHVVVGLGRTGVSCVRHLRARGIAVCAMDSRERPPGLEALDDRDDALRLVLGRFDPDLLRSARRVVLSPGVSLAEPAVAAAVAAGVPVVGDIELFAELADAPVVAVTGSNGKSTVTRMVAAMAERAGHAVRAGGNLGTPALDLLDAGATLYVLELSSFQLETTHTLAPVAAAVLNVTPDHLDRYRDVAAYARAKQRILAHARVAVLNLDDPLTRAMAAGARGVVGFTLQAPVGEGLGLREHGGTVWLARDGVSLMPARDLGLPGRHNVANALAALALGLAADLELAPMLEALRAFRGLPHRCEVVAEHAGVRWINDSKGTNVGATVAAIEGLAAEGPLVLIAGGEGKGADFSPLAAALAERAREVILLGRDATLIADALAPAGLALERATSLDDAVARARVVARSGDTVLFSPACASFDMFVDYEARGEAFAAAVREMLGR